MRSPQSNGMAKSFVQTFKRYYVYLNDLQDGATVLVNCHGGSKSPTASIHTTD